MRPSCNLPQQKSTPCEIFLNPLKSSRQGINREMIRIIMGSIVLASSATRVMTFPTLTPLRARTTTSSTSTHPHSSLSILAAPETYIANEISQKSGTRITSANDVVLSNGRARIKGRRTPGRPTNSSKKSLRTPELKSPNGKESTGTTTTPSAHLSKTTITPSSRRKPTKLTGSRSSTMPGFSSSTKRMRNDEEGIKIFEDRSGRKMKIDKMKIADIRKANSDRMYLDSNTVPDSLVQFVREIHQESRITPAEEKALGARTQEAIHLQELHDNLISKLHREPTDDEYCLAAGKIDMESLTRTIEDGMEAKNLLVTSNLRMVQGVVNLYIRNGLGSQYNAGDLMQEGTLALIRAAEKFEPHRGFRFSTYAMYWIRASIKRSQILQSRIIYVPQRLHENYKKYLDVEAELQKELGRNPTSDETAQSMGLTVAQLERCTAAMSQQCLSLDADLLSRNSNNHGDNKKRQLYDLVEGKADESENSRLDQMFLKEDLVNSLRKYITPHEVDLLLLRYGLMDEKTLPHGFLGPLTISKVSLLTGIKPDKVRRMINNALRKLRLLSEDDWCDQI